MDEVVCVRCLCFHNGDYQPVGCQIRNPSGTGRIGVPVGGLGTPGGEVVWEYTVPVMDSLSSDAALEDIYKKVISDTDHNWTFAAHWYPPDHPGLAGRDLTRKGKITDILN